MPLDRADIGAWVFRCNPNDWDIVSALENGKSIDSWRVRESYRLDLIEPGDPAVIWVTGPRDGDPTPGIWLVGRTTGQLFDDSGDEYWIDKDRQQTQSIYAGLEMWPLESPLSRADLQADPRTADMEVLRQPQMSNPSVLSPEEKRAVEEMLGGWPTGPSLSGAPAVPEQSSRQGLWRRLIGLVSLALSPSG